MARKTITSKSDAARAATQEAERLVDEGAAADILGVSVRTLQAWRVKGGGPVFVRVGRAIRYAISDLNTWIAGRKASSTSENAA